MKKLYSTFFFIILSLVYAKAAYIVAPGDTNEVKRLNKSGYENRLQKPAQTVVYATKALQMATDIKYEAGKAEAYRIIGIGKAYLNKADTAMTNYFQALDIFTKLGDLSGQANVYNNIGNLYQEADYVQALDYFRKAEDIAKATHNEVLIAKINLNRGNIFYHQSELNKALSFYTASYNQFTKLGIKEYIIQCQQDLGITYKKLNEIDKAEKILLQANHDAKALDMNSSVASINFTLFDIYIAKHKYDEAEKFLKEGETCATLINNDRDLNDYNRSWYELEYARKNYQAAIGYIKKILDKDSVIYNSTMNNKISLATKQNEHDKEESEKKNASQRFWLLAVMAGLLLVVVGLLMSNVKRKAATNAKLTELNNEVSRQKDNLDRINHHLEEIIDERTRDLQVKNKKLSDYSSYLSHQIRGPIATLKGLMNLEREGLVDQAECIVMMDKCVSEIDEKIIEMSDMLHDPGKSGF